MGVEIEDDGMYHYSDITLRVYEDGIIQVDNVADIGGNIEYWDEMSEELGEEMKGRIELMEDLPQDAVM